MPEQHYFSQEPSGELKISKVDFEVAGHNFSLQAASGTFSSTKLDAGTKVLLKESELFPSSGDVLDLGCGWGPISIVVASLSPKTTVWGLDVNARSLELVGKNADSLGLKNVRPVTAEELPLDFEFDGIWSNPPIRIGKAALHHLMQTWLPRLKPGAAAMLVVQKQLGAESFQQWLTDTFVDFKVTKHSIDKGYRVIRVVRPTKSR